MGMIKVHDQSMGFGSMGETVTESSENCNESMIIGIMPRGTCLIGIGKKKTKIKNYVNTNLCPLAQ